MHHQGIHKKKPLRKGFSTGTSAAAAIMAAVRVLLGGHIRDFVAVRLPAGFYLPVPVDLHRRGKHYCVAEVRKDGGDDPDITHGAIIRAEVSLVRKTGDASGIWLDAGEGVGVVTKPGLPVSPGEPAVNPVPRRMISENIAHTFLAGIHEGFLVNPAMEKLPELPSQEPGRRIFLALPSGVNLSFDIYVILSVPGGEILAKRTLNPRLGVVGGLSILGTSGLVNPFSNEAYEETIDYALRYAKTNGCSGVVLTTGGKSEYYARRVFSQYPESAFVQVADFFGFSVKKAEEYGFYEIIHAVFFGKAVKMALGFFYTHAREGLIDMKKLAFIAGLSGEVEDAVVRANTAREVLDILKERFLYEAIERICKEALRVSFGFSPGIPRRRIVLFDYDGKLLHEESMMAGLSAGDIGSPC